MKTYSNTFRSWLSLCSLSLAVGVAACGGSNNDAKEAAPPPPDSAAPATDLPAATSTAPAPTDTPPASDATPPAPAPLNDAQIAAVTAAANKGEIDQGKLAQTKAKNAKVKKFAAHMVHDHGDADKKQTKLLAKANVTPADNPVSTQIQSDGSSTLESLKGLSGPDFDKAYIDAQVKEHQTVLDALDNKLLPNVKDADFKTFLQGVRDKVAGHLKAAQDIQGSLGAK